MKFGEKRGEVIRMDTYNMIDFNEKKGFICDMDGVIYHGNRVLPGVAEFIQWLHNENKEYLFLTNNSGYTPRELSQKLARMGLDVTEEHFYTSALATAAFLRDQAPGCSVFAIGEAGLLNALYDAGITMNDVNPDYVVVGEGRSYSLDTLTKATNLVWKGAKLIGANSDVSGPIENGIVPACRALVAPIEMATGTQAYFCGKPNPLMMRTGLRMLHCHSAEAVMVGDRMDTDVISGMESGMSTVLVLSGVSTRETIKTYAYRPSMVLNGVGDIVSLVEKAQENIDIDPEEAGDLARRMKNADFTLDDFLSQMQQIKKMGPLSGILKMLPGMGAIGDIDIPDDAMKKPEAIIRSMTPKERRRPEILNASRRRRIAAGSGTTVQDVNQLIRQFEEMKKQMKMVMNQSRGKKGRFRFPPMR